MRDLDDWQRKVFGVKEAPPEKPAPPISVEIKCQLCEYGNAVMVGFVELFYLEHVPQEDGSVRHFMRSVPR